MWWCLQPMDESGPVSLPHDAIDQSARRITFFGAGVPGVVGRPGGFEKVDEADDPLVTISCLCAAPRKLHDLDRHVAQLSGAGCIRGRRQERLSQESAMCRRACAEVDAPRDVDWGRSNGIRPSSPRDVVVYEGGRRRGLLRRLCRLRFGHIFAPQMLL